MPFFENFKEINIDFEKYLPFKCRNIIYHYTNFNNWKSVFLNNNCQNGIVLYASRIDCLNDTMENQLATELYNEVLNEISGEAKFPSEIIDMFRNIKPHTEFPLRSKDVETYYDCYIYATCFSQSKDLLNMWKYYSKENGYNGLNIGLYDDLEENVTGIDKPFKVMVYPIVYDKEEQKDLIKRFIKDFMRIEKKDFIDKESPEVINTFVEDALSVWNTIFKSEYFKEEQEVRILVFVPKNSKNNIEYRQVGTNIVPYIKLQINKKAVNSIRIGPIDSKTADKNITIIKEALNDKFPDIEISKSNIPLRY